MFCKLFVDQGTWRDQEDVKIRVTSAEDKCGLLFHMSMNLKCVTLGFSAVFTLKLEMS